MDVTAPPMDLDPFDEGFLADPYEGHEAMRDAGPVVYLAVYEVYGMARHEQVHAVLNDPETFCSSAGVGLSDFRKEKPWRPPSLLLEADPPAHDGPRHAITQVLSPRTVKQLRDTFTAEAERMVDQAIAGGSFDGVTDLAEPYPLKVFPDAVGLPADDRQNLMAYGAMVFNGFGPRNRLFEESMARGAAVREWIMAHCDRENLAEGGLGDQIYETAAAEGMTDDEAALLVRSFLSAGVDTTVHGLGNALLCLAQNPAQWTALRDDPSRARAAFEETIRYEAPVQTFFRTTTRPVEIGGVTIDAGEKVLLFLGAANRDPREWDDADIFDIGRRASGHVGFGSGIHACVGQMMARLEGELILTALAERVQTLEINGPVERQLSNTLRGLEHLPLAVTPRTS